MRQFPKAVAVVFASLGLLAAMAAIAPGAGAETTIDAEPGFDGFNRPGEPRPIRIVITADRLIDGVLEVSVTSTGPIPTTELQRTRVQIAGGTTKEITLLAAPDFTFNGFGGSVTRIRLLEDEEEIAAQVVRPGRSLTNAELVGVLPELAADAPERTLTLPELGAIWIRPLPVDWVELDGSMGALDMVALTPAEFSQLSSEAKSALVRWAWKGGTVVSVGADPAAIAATFDGVEPTWGRQVFGLGAVHTIAQTADWFDQLVPTSLELDLNEPGSEMMMGGGFFPSMPVSQSLAEDAGVQLPSLPWLTGLLLAYVVLVGPVAWFVLRRLNRTTGLWLAIPAIALGFTIAVWGVGSSMRSGQNSAHATIIEVTPGGAYATSAQLLASRTGGVEQLGIPDGWRIHQPKSSQFGFGPFPDSSQGTPLVGENMLDSPTLSANLDAGDFAIARVGGPIAGFDSAITVQAFSNENGSIEGTVTNNLSVDVHDVGVLGDNAGQNVGTIRAGESVEFDLGRPRDPFMNEPIEMRLWPELGGMFFEGPFPMGGRAEGVNSDGSEGDLSNAFSSGLWSEYSGSGSARPVGQVVVAAFTRELVSPVDSDVEAGRTMVVARSAVEATGLATDVSVMTETIDADVNFNGNGPPDYNGTWRFTLPQSWSPDDAAVITVPKNAAKIEILESDQWTQIEHDAGDVIVLESSMLRDRTVYVRASIDIRNGPPAFAPRSLAVRQADPNDELSMLVRVSTEQDDA